MIYQPEKDSYLLQKVLKENILNKKISVLEIGIGSGIQLETLKELGIKNIQGVDINPEAVEHCKNLGFNCFESNLFENVKGKFDLILFNPPYLPEDKREDEESRLATTGGKKGSEIINKFLC
jgi:release factor glutamine methyltransferase